MSEKSSNTGKQTSETENSIQFSNSIVQRLEYDAVDEQKFTDNENSWINKLANIDDDHSRSTGLNINDAERLLRSMTSYAYTKSEPTCPLETSRVTTCLTTNKTNTLSCEREVENFKKCIDKLLCEAVRKDMKDVRTTKKDSYARAFDRKYQL